MQLPGSRICPRRIAGASLRSRTGRKIATWVLALALGVQAALIVTDLAGGVVPAPAGSHRHSDIRPHPAAVRERRRSSPTRTCSASAQVEARSADAANAPQTSMPLVLTGIIAGGRPAARASRSSARAPARQRCTAVGDTLPGRRQAARRVRRPGARWTATAASSRSPCPASSHEQRRRRRPRPPCRPAESPVVERMRRLIADQPGAVSDIMRPQPVFAQGKQRGYRVYPGRNRQAFVRLGLRPGRPGDRHQRHAARRSGARPGDFPDTGFCQ